MTTKQRQQLREFHAWWRKVTKYMWGEGTPTDHPDVLRFEPLECFKKGMLWQDFVTMVDKQLHPHVQGFASSAEYYADLERRRSTR